MSRQHRFAGNWMGDCNSPTESPEYVSQSLNTIGTQRYTIYLPPTLLGTPIHMQINATIQPAIHVAAATGQKKIEEYTGDFFPLVFSCIFLVRLGLL